MLVHILSDITGLFPGVLTWISGSVHLYENQVKPALEQLERTPRQLPKLGIEWSAPQKELIENGRKNGFTSGEITRLVSEMDFDGYIGLSGYNPNFLSAFPLCHSSIAELAMSTNFSCEPD